MYSFERRKAYTVQDGLKVWGGGGGVMEKFSFFDVLSL